MRKVYITAIALMITLTILAFVFTDVGNILYNKECKSRKQIDNKISEIVTEQEEISYNQCRFIGADIEENTLIIYSSLSNFNHGYHAKVLFSITNSQKKSLKSSSGHGFYKKLLKTINESEYKVDNVTELRESSSIAQVFLDRWKVSGCDIVISKGKKIFTKANFKNNYYYTNAELYDIYPDEIAHDFDKNEIILKLSFSVSQLQKSKSIRGIVKVKAVMPFKSVYLSGSKFNIIKIYENFSDYQYRESITITVDTVKAASFKYYNIIDSFRNIDDEVKPAVLGLFLVIDFLLLSELLFHMIKWRHQKSEEKEQKIANRKNLISLLQCVLPLLVCIIILLIHGISEDWLWHVTDGNMAVIVIIFLGFMMLGHALVYPLHLILLRTKADNNENEKITWNLNGKTREVRAICSEKRLKVSRLFLIPTAFIYDVITVPFKFLYFIVFNTMSFVWFIIRKIKGNYNFQDKENFQKIIDYCKVNGYKVTHKKPKTFLKGVNSRIYGNGVNDNEVWYAIGKSRNSKFLFEMGRVAGYFNAKFACVGKVAIFLKGGGEEAARLYESLQELLGASEIETVSIDSGVTRPPTLKEKLRHPKMFIKKMRSKNPNNLAARIVAGLGALAIIAGITLFILSLTKTVDIKWGVGFLIMLAGTISAAIGVFIFDEFGELKIFDKIIKWTALILFVTVIVAIILFIVFCLLCLLMIMIIGGAMDGSSAPQRRSSGGGQPEEEGGGFKSMGKGNMVLDGMHYKIEKTDGSSIGLESYDQATGVGKGYDGKTYVVQGGGMTHK